MPTCSDVSWNPPPGAPGEAQIAHEMAKMPERCELWACSGFTKHPGIPPKRPHPMVIIRGRRSRCRTCGFTRRMRFADERLNMQA